MAKTPIYHTLAFSVTLDGVPYQDVEVRYTVSWGRDMVWGSTPDTSSPAEPHEIPDITVVKIDGVEPRGHEPLARIVEAILDKNFDALIDHASDKEHDDAAERKYDDMLDRMLEEDRDLPDSYPGDRNEP